ncbi:MAG TPA: SURF1 family protein [Gemmatimonadales bacterium]|nr:SURF1 family protein [Gemmatimonadales bacterium]
MAGHPPARWLFLILALATAAVCTRLGFWQLSRLAERRASNAAALAGLAAPPATLPGPRPPSPGIRVHATGSYDLDHQFVLRGRAHDGAPGVEIATPFRMPGDDSALIVLRGFVPSDNATSVDLVPLAEPGTRSIDGIAFALTGAADSGAPVERQGTTTWSHLDLAAIRARLPYPVYGVALWQEKDSATSRMPIRLGAPEMSEGPHLNYAIQWFGFALIFAGGGVVFALRKRDEKGENAPA